MPSIRLKTGSLAHSLRKAWRRSALGTPCFMKAVKSESAVSESISGRSGGGASSASAFSPVSSYCVASTGRSAFSSRSSGAAPPRPSRTSALRRDQRLNRLSSEVMAVAPSRTAPVSGLVARIVAEMATLFAFFKRLVRMVKFNKITQPGDHAIGHRHRLY